VKNLVFNYNNTMEQIIKFAELTYKVEVEYLKTLEVLKGMFKDKEGFIANHESIINMMVMSLPTFQREKITMPYRFDGSLGSEKWHLNTRHSFARIVLRMIRSNQLTPEKKEEPKEAPKNDVEIVNQPEAKRQRTD
jgi:hypothetical protein